MKLDTIEKELMVEQQGRQLQALSGGPLLSSSQTHSCVSLQNLYGIRNGLHQVCEFGHLIATPATWTCCPNHTYLARRDCRQLDLL
eukprot:2984193-Amphidinium_carterae.1